MVKETTNRVTVADPEKGVPELLDFVAKDDIQVELRKLNKHMEKQEFKGLVDSRTLNVTAQLQSIPLDLEWPLEPWITATAHNYGPNTAFLSINTDFDWVPLRIGEGHNFDFSGSEKRIFLIYHRCNPAETATVQINGKY